MCIVNVRQLMNIGLGQSHQAACAFPAPPFVLGPPTRNEGVRLPRNLHRGSGNGVPTAGE